MRGMAPPRDLDPASAVADAGAPTLDEYDALCEEIAQVQGVINLASARLVELTRRGMDLGVSGGTNLRPREWLAWRAGIAPERAASFVKVAERAHELPHTVAALVAGELTVDQAAVIARHVPVRFEESAAEVARSCTVAQLRFALPHYRDRKPPRPKADDATDPDAHGHITSRTDDTGYHLHLHLRDAARGAVVDQALKAMREDLQRQARADAPDGATAPPVFAADAMVALAETALLAGEAARPGTDRYLVHVHLQAGPQGLELLTHQGIPIPEAERRHLLCDAKLRGLVHDGHGVPLGTGRTTRAINRRMRRAVEFRDGHCCSVPGCGRTTGLEIHHIIHWEDGGVTETHNLIALCGFHHRGTLGISGNADLPRHTAPGVVFTNGWGRPLDPAGQPVVPPRPERGSGHGSRPAAHLASAAAVAGVGRHCYQPPTGERLDPWGFHPIEADPPGPDPADEPAPPPPRAGASGHPPAVVDRDSSCPEGGTATDPTRAGPAVG